MFFLLRSNKLPTLDIYLHPSRLLAIKPSFFLFSAGSRVSISTWMGCHIISSFSSSSFSLHPNIIIQYPPLRYLICPYPHIPISPHLSPLPCRSIYATSKSPKRELRTVRQGKLGCKRLQRGCWVVVVRWFACSCFCFAFLFFCFWGGRGGIGVWRKWMKGEEGEGEVDG